MISVLFQSCDFWVVVKPAGESFHSESGVGFFQRLSNTFSEQKFYPVHRLDKMTSGLLLVACNKSSSSALVDLFSERGVEKRYLAISNKKPKKKQGTIKGVMSPGRNGQWRFSKEGKIAETQFHSSFIGDRRFFYVRPLTGRTHQIRVALKSIGAPILGDVRYGGGESDRGYLHAYRLGFRYAGYDYDFCSLPMEGDLFSDAVHLQLESCFNESEIKWPKAK